MADLVPPDNTGPPSPDKPSEALRRHRLEWADSATEVEEQERVAVLPKETRLAVYVQKYEMFRHFDTLRWQVPGLVLAVGGGLFGFAPKMPNGLPHFLATGAYSMFALAGAFLMHRIRHNLRANNRVLRQFAISLGDFGIPAPPRARSASTWMELLLIALGIGSLALTVLSAP